jgi:hypothetical protein
MLLPPPDIGAAYVDKNSGQASKDLYNWVRSLYDTLRALGDEIELITTARTVADLPAPTVGKRALVSDATASAFNTVANGGGSNIVPVFADGTDWRIG